MPPFSPTNTLPPGAKAMAVGRVSPLHTAESRTVGTAAAGRRGRGRRRPGRAAEDLTPVAGRPANAGPGSNVTTTMARMATGRTDDSHWDPSPLGEGGQHLHLSGLRPQGVLLPQGRGPDRAEHAVQPGLQGRWSRRKCAGRGAPDHSQTKERRNAAGVTIESERPGRDWTGRPGRSRLKHERPRGPPARGRSSAA